MKSIKTTIVAVTVGAALLGGVNAAQISLGNFAGASFFGIADTGGTAVPNGGGFITTGAFSTFDNAAITAAISGPGATPETYAALLADFQDFGAGGTFGGSGAGDSPGLYIFDNSGPVTAGDAFDGRTIYTLGTSSANLASAVDIFVYEHTASFAPDAPLFTADANIATDTGTLVIGTPGDVTTLAGTNPGAFAVATPVPEPSTFGILALAGGVVLLRRRKR